MAQSCLLGAAASPSAVEALTDALSLLAVSTVAHITQPAH